MPLDDFNLRELRDQLWDSPNINYECTECSKPCGPDIEWCDDSGKPNGTFICEICSDALAAADAKAEGNNK